MSGRGYISPIKGVGLIVYFLSCRFIAPIEGVGLILWWIVEKIVNNPDSWWQITVDSLATVLTEWLVVLLVFTGLNWWLKPLVIYSPRNDPKLKTLLGMFFRLSRRPDPPTPPIPSRTPEVDMTVL